MSELATVTTIAASHDALVTGDRVTWRSVFVGNAPSRATWDALEIPLARPIAGELDAARSPGVAPVVAKDGRIVALAIDAGRLPSWPAAIAVTLVTPRGHEGDAELLAPPLAAGDAVQRVSLDGDGELRFAPDGAVEHHVGYWIARDVSDHARERCDDDLAMPRAIDVAPIYLTAADAPQALRGHATTAADRAHAGAIGVTLLSVIGVALLAWGYRSLTGRARVEQAEAMLREEYERVR